MNLDLDANGPLLDSLFPSDMTLKVISIDLAGIDVMINARLLELGIAKPCRPGHLSKLGKYITWEVDARFATRADFHAVMTSLAAIEGVKYVL
jgi:putative lipoic acid-binding regulatory protein